MKQLIQIATKLRLKWGKKEAIERKTNGFKEAKQIGVMFDASSGHDSLVQMDKQLAQLVSEHKKLQVLVFHAGKQDPPQMPFPCVFFSHKDFDFWGHLKKDSPAAAFTATRFDYLCYIGLVPGPVFGHYVLDKSLASCRIGPYGKGQEHFFELMVDTGPDLESLKRQILHYLREIRVKKLAA